MAAHFLRRTTSSIEDPNNLPADVASIDDQLSYTDRQLESPRARAARIEVKHSVARLLLGDVAVAANHDVESRSFRFQIELGQVVQHVDGRAAEFDDFGLRKLARPPTFIDVASDRGERRQRRQLLNDLGIANIACVDDVFRPTQNSDSFRTKQAVCIRDDADEYSRLSVLSCEFASHQLIHFSM